MQNIFCVLQCTSNRTMMYINYIVLSYINYIVLLYIIVINVNIGVEQSRIGMLKWLNIYSETSLNRTQIKMGSCIN